MICYGLWQNTISMYFLFEITKEINCFSSCSKSNRKLLAIVDRMNDSLNWFSYGFAFYNEMFSIDFLRIFFRAFLFELKTIQTIYMNRSSFLKNSLHLIDHSNRFSFFVWLFVSVCVWVYLFMYAIFDCVFVARL